jgi:hypothetical protein
MKSLSLLILALPLGACLPATPSYLTVSADPSADIRPVRYTTVTAGVRVYDVVEPLDWRELNRRVGPGRDPERGDSNDAARRGR